MCREEAVFYATVVREGERLTSILEKQDCNLSGKRAAGAAETFQLRVRSLSSISWGAGEGWCVLAPFLLPEECQAQLLSGPFAEEQPRFCLDED